uniref:Ig-like domain-containing protein n=1 Tax=Haemonchus contortus TaxID=6289 RepID=A0A7I4YW89_HAECO
SCVDYIAPIYHHNNPSIQRNFSPFRKMLRLLLLTFALSAIASCTLRIIGNLAIVAKPKGHAGTELAPVQTTVSEFWCAAEKLGEKVPIEYGEFTRLRDGKVFEAKIKDNKAKLHIGKVPATAAGRYMCEVRTSEGHLLKGFLSMYCPPVLRLPTGSIFHEVPSVRPPKVIGAVKKALAGERLELLCPVIGYPEPFARWEKDGAAIEPSPLIEYDGNNLIITQAEATMNGVYACIADNSFPMFVDGPAMPHQLIFEQKVIIDS